MAGPSNPNPEILFHFKITPLTQIRLAFDALSDSDFNPTGLGVLQLTEKAVEFTARNVDTNVTGYLRLNSTALKSFYFNSRCKGRLFRINFRRIFEIITNDDNINEESITFSHFDGSGNIIVNLGNDAVKVFDLPLLTIVPGFKSVPDFELVCEAIIPSYSLREMLDQLKSLGFNELVSVNISKERVVVRVGDRLWVFNDDTVDLTRGMSPDQHHQAWFHWPHLEALRKASHIVPAVPLCFLIQPRDAIMTRFTLRELGDLVFFDNAATIILNFKLIGSISATTTLRNMHRFCNSATCNG